MLIAAIVGLLMYVNHLDLIGKNYFTSNLSALILVAIIAFTLIFSFIKEKKFAEAKTTVFEAFVSTIPPRGQRLPDSCGRKNAQDGNREKCRPPTVLVRRYLNS